MTMTERAEVPPLQAQVGAITHAGDVVDIGGVGHAAGLRAQRELCEVELAHALPVATVASLGCGRSLIIEPCPTLSLA
jgi:hypothetical protein